MSTATLPNVALVRTGEWNSATTGATPITEADLDQMVAAHQDQIVDRPVIKIGHDSSLNDPLGDGEPAYGWIENVSRGDGSAERPQTDTLYGDYVGMPSKLAEVAPAAYRRRSVEIAWGVKTAAGKAYNAVLTGVALLGIQKPAVKGLGDVLALYSEDVTERGQVSVIEQVDVDRGWLSTFAEANSLSESAVLSMVSQLAGQVAPDADTNVVPHEVADRPEGEPDKTTPIEEGKRMTINKADVQKALEEAGDEDVTARLRELLDETAETPATVTTIVPPVQVTTPAGVTVTAAAEGDDDTVVITKSVFAELQAGAAAGSTAQKEIDAQRRDALVVTAFREGRITQTERQTWRDKLDENEEITTSLLSALTPRFAVEELGSDLAVETHLSEAEESAYTDFVGSLGLGI